MAAVQLSTFHRYTHFFIFGGSLLFNHQKFTQRLKKFFLKSSLQLLVFTAGIVLIFQGLGSAFPQWLYHNIVYLYLYFFILTTLSLLVLDQVQKHQPEKFVNSYFGIMVARLFISLGVALVFIFLDRPNAKVFVANFTVLYLFFLGFEIYGILTNLRHHFKKGTEND
jgi:hypothetical protein